MKEIENSSVYLKKLYPKVEQNLKIQGSSLVREIVKFMDFRSEVLTASGPTKRMIFSDMERAKFCKYMGLTLGEIDRVIDEVTNGVRFKVIHKPFNVACVLAIKAFRNLKRSKEEKLIAYLLGLSLYSSLHVKYFEFLPNENIMNYTINNLTNKYKIKQLGTVGKTIEYTCVTTHETYTDLIQLFSDSDVHKYIMNMNTRLNGFLQNIASEFYDNHKKGNYLNTEEDNYEDESYHETDNNSLVIERISGSVALTLISKGLDHTLAEAAAKQSGISVSALKNAIIEINNKRDKDIRELISCILQVYLDEGRFTARSIKSRNFIAMCHSIYLKSNTSDQSIIRIKEILDSWLTECSTNYVKTERIATKNNFRKAVYMYYVLNIMKSYQG